VALGRAGWVEEVWVNYLSNAIKYSGQPPTVHVGYGTHDLGLPKSQQTKSEIQNRESQITFWVRDNGPGLTAEEKAQLFAPFERLHQVRVEGHGLGLSIVRRIIEKLGGQVGVESKPGAGSLFFFTLPADENPQGQAGD